MEIIFAAIVALLTAQVATTAVPVTNPACSVAVIEKHPESVQILGLEDVASRVRVTRQDDSPIAITLIDLTNLNLSTGPGFASTSGTYAIQIRNVSDTRIADARVALRIGSKDGSFGSYVRLSRPLGPAEVTRLETSSRGAGQNSNGEDYVIEVWVDSVTLPGCVFRPAIKR